MADVKKTLVQLAIDEAVIKRGLPSPSPGSTPAAQAPASAHSRGLFNRIRAKFDPNWDPSEHPRDLKGRFTRATAAALLVTAAISGAQATMHMAEASTEGHGKPIPTQTLPNPDHDKPDPSDLVHDDEQANPNLPRAAPAALGFDLHFIGDSLPPADLDNIKIVLQRGKEGAPAKIVKVIQKQLATIQELQADQQAKPAPASGRGVNPTVAPRPGGKVQLSPALHLQSQVTDRRPQRRG